MQDKKTHKVILTKLDKILELREKGLTLREIGVVVKLSAERIRQILKKYQFKK